MLDNESTNKKIITVAAVAACTAGVVVAIRNNPAFRIERKRKRQEMKQDLMIKVWKKYGRDNIPSSLYSKWCMKVDNLFYFNHYRTANKVLDVFALWNERIATLGVIQTAHMWKSATLRNNEQLNEKEEATVLKLIEVFANDGQDFVQLIKIENN